MTTPGPADVEGAEVDPFAVTLPPQPYPGLRPFTKEEWPIFFGRERMADAVVSQLIEKRLLVIHGDSGCGKSSLVAAAVLPRLEQESARGGIRWVTCAAHPGDSPLWNLAAGLAELTGNAGEEEALEIRRRLNFGRGAPAALAALLRRSPGDCVCVLIDQFEELFAHAAQHGPDEARLLTDFLVALHAEPPDGFYAVLTMRSEFLGACARFDGFAEVVNATQYLLPRMGHNDLLRAIREPAPLYEGEVTRDLAERLVADAGGGQDQLPLIQHGIMLLHRGVASAAGEGDPEDPPQPWRLGLEHYTPGSGLKRLLSDHADAVLAEALRRFADAAGGERIVEDIFRALTDINADGQAVRRPRTLSQLAAVTGAGESTLRSVIDTFRVEGVSFLRPYGTGPIDGDDRIDISHEALIRCWQKIADPIDGWLIREFRNGLVWRSLLVQADSFELDPTNVLAPATADEREKWMRPRNEAWAERYGGGWGRVQALIRASAEARDKERAERSAARERDERSKRRDQWLKVLLGASAVLVGLLAWVFYLSTTKSQALAEKRQAVADLQQQVTIANNARQQAEDARQRSEALAHETESSAAELRELVEYLRRKDQMSVRPYSQTVRELEEVADKLAVITRAAPAASLAPRVYVHIADEKYREAAAAFERQLEAVEIGGMKVVVPGIQRVTAPPPSSVLRCFRREECGEEGKALLAAANALLREPQLTLQDLSGRYGRSTKIRPRHYEIWFAPGEISLNGR